MSASGASVATWCLLCIAVGRCFAADSFLDDISRNLHSKMSDVVDSANVTYSTPIINVTYKAHVEFDMRAMGPLYNATKVVIDTIANKQAYPEGIVTVADGHLEVGSAREHWRELLTHYAGPTAVVAVALLLVALLPLGGLLWCCCRWCRSGRRRRPFDRKYDACLKGVLAIVLIALLTLFLFGLVCAFATEEQLERGASEAPDTLRMALRDTREWVNASQAHARWLLVTNYDELRRALDAMLTNAGLAVSVHLGQFTRAVSVTTLNNMVQRLDAVQADLRAVHNLTGSLRYNAERLNSGLRKVKAQLLQTLAKCEQPQCVRLQQKYKIGQLDTEIQYSQMPDVTELLNNVTMLLDSNIKAEVAEGQKVFNEIQRGIQRSVEEHIPGVRQALEETGRRLEELADRISGVAGEADETLQRWDYVPREMDEVHARYGQYRRHAGRAAAAALLLVVALLTWGLLCGVCGKRPDAYGAADCCNKGAGANSLLCGVCVMFAVGGAVALVLLVYFVVGVAAQRFACDPLAEPRGNRLAADLEAFVDLERALYDEHRDPDFNLTSVLVHCHANRTVYDVLQLQRLYSVERLREELGREVQARAEALRPHYRPPTPLSILKPSARDKLQRLADTGLSEFQFDRILLALETNVTSLALDALAAQLDATARSLESRPGFARVSMELLDAAALLSAYHADIVLPMLKQTQRLNTTAVQLRDGLRFNHSSLKEAISYLMYETATAEAFLNAAGPETVRNMTLEFAHKLGTLLDEYLVRVGEGAHYHVGRCGPLSAAFNATRAAGCRGVLLPLNGYWLSLAWCVLLFPPVMLVASKLARLYTALDPYPGPLVEAEYLYDAYADRDNVPLANSYKAEKRTGRGEARAEPRGEARGRGARDEVEPPRGALAPASDAPLARRYNDMAPKHWEEGPPRYHTPTEYERPPPYYYPGPHDRQ